MTQHVLVAAGRARGPARVAAVVTLLLAFAGYAAALTVPLYATSSESGTVSPAGDVVTSSSESTGTVLQVSGVAPLLVLAVPVVAAVLPVVARRPRAVRALLVLSAVALACVTVLGALSVGYLFAPAALSAVVAALLPLRGGAATATAGGTT